MGRGAESCGCLGCVPGVLQAEWDCLCAIFVSYRRKDSEGEAGRLFDDLATHFGAESVFMDVSAIQPGRDFRKAIDQSVRTCNASSRLVPCSSLHSSHPAQ